MSGRLSKFIKLEPVISIGLSVLLLISAYILQSTPENMTYTYQNGSILYHSSRDFFQILAGLTILLTVALCVAGSIGCIAVWLQQRQKTGIRAVLIWLTTILCLVLILISSAVAKGRANESNYYPECYSFTDGQHAIVIEEKSFLLGGYGTVFQIKNDHQAVVIGSFTTDDGGRNKGQYTINWADTYADITYHTFSTKDSISTLRVELQ